MHIPRFIIIAAVVLTGIFAIGCSKSGPLPIVRFHGYQPSHDGGSVVTFEFRNPSQEVMYCRVQIVPTDSGGSGVITIPAAGSTSFSTFVKQTNDVSATVTVVKLISGRHFTVTAP